MKSTIEDVCRNGQYDYDTDEITRNLKTNRLPNSFTLFRTTDTLPGGETQRLKLAKYVGKRP